MSAEGPDTSGTPEERDGETPIPEEVWWLFLADSERAIRASAPRELSAQERVPGWHPKPNRERTERQSRRSHAHPTHDGTEAVGELWQPEDPWAGPAWRDLDGRARLRRVGRVIGTAVAIALALGAWSQLSTGTGIPTDDPSGTTLQQSEDVPGELPTAPSLLPGPASADPSSSTVRAG